jgi:hypothetical protein
VTHSQCGLYEPIEFYIQQKSSHTKSQCIFSKTEWGNLVPSIKLIVHFKWLWHFFFSFLIRSTIASLLRKSSSWLIERLTS